MTKNPFSMPQSDQADEDRRQRNWGESASIMPVSHVCFQEKSQSDACLPCVLGAFQGSLEENGLFCCLFSGEKVGCAAMQQILDLMDDIVTASTALAGLILVFMGAIVTAYEAYSSVEQQHVKARYWRRACFSLVGLILALATCVLSLVAKGLNAAPIALITLVLFACTLISVLFTSCFYVREIR